MTRSRLRRTVVAAVLIGLAASAAPARADTPPPRLIDIVEVSWPGAPARAVTADDLVATLRSDTIPRWRQLSNGAVEFSLDTVLPQVQMTSALPCDASGSVDFMNKVALTAFTDAGFRTWDNRYLLMLTPAVPNCIWAGRGVLNPPGSTAGLLLLNGTADPLVVAHELGHNLGLGHSNLETCTGGRDDGPWADCSAVEYGSAIDIMGNTDRSSPLNAYHQWRLGLIPDADVAVGDRTMRVQLQPVDTSTGTRAIFLRDRSAAYWVEYRRADPANQVREGLVVYRTDPPPASSVVSPLAEQAVDPIGNALTTDVWMIDLGDYRYTYPPTGSPSLASGVPFTTAFGGATITARPSGAGVEVTVDRSAATAPAAPVWTDRSAWTGPSASLIRSDLDDGGVAITRFEVRMTTDSGTSIANVEPTRLTGYRTYLSPLGSALTVRAGSLPEGRYSAQLRAVNALGLAGPWSSAQQVSIDLGAPEVSATGQLASVQPGRSVTLRWTGVRDAGAGICAARRFDAGGFARLQWSATAPGTPSFRLPASAADSGTALVQDCFGNVTAGTLTLATAWTGADALSRTGQWSIGSAPRCLGSTCSVRLRTTGGITGIVIGQGAGRVLVDGRLLSRFSRARNDAPRIVARVSGAHRVEVRGSGLHLWGAQSLTLAWAASAEPVQDPPPVDDSLADDAQAALSRLGFSQGDFAPGNRVLPIDGGTGTDQPTLDLCNGTFASEAERQYRRQVLVSGGSANGLLFLSSETVRYWSSQAVTRALGELDTAEQQCRSRGYSVDAQGNREAYAFADVPTLPDGLQPAAQRRVYLVTIGTGDSARTALIVYQFRGPLLNALYVVKSGADSLDSATVARWLDAATVFAERLRAASV